MVLTSLNGLGKWMCICRVMSMLFWHMHSDVYIIQILYHVVSRIKHFFEVVIKYTKTIYSMEIFKTFFLSRVYHNTFLWNKAFQSLTERLYFTKGCNMLYSEDRNVLNSSLECSFFLLYHLYTALHFTLIDRNMG